MYVILISVSYHYGTVFTNIVPRCDRNDTQHLSKFSRLLEQNELKRCPTSKVPSSDTSISHQSSDGF